MPLPEGFSEWEHLQDQVRRIHNREVMQTFNDIAEENDISTPRGSLKHACLIKDDDTSVMVQIRLWLFEVTVGHAASLHPPIYGIPTDTYQQHVTFKPQVVLHFEEDAEDVDAGFKPLRSEISFRLTSSQYENVIESEARQLANRINSLFGVSNGFRFHKGRVKCVYKHLDLGYNLTIHAFSESEGKRVIEQVLDVQSHTPDWNRLTLNSLSTSPPTLPPQQAVYGKLRRIPRKRPVGYVRFKRAELHLWGLASPVILIDRTGQLRNALISPLRAS